MFMTKQVLTLLLVVAWYCPKKNIVVGVVGGMSCSPAQHQQQQVREYYFATIPPP